MLLWIVFGGLAGWIATGVMDVGTEYGMLGNIIIGIIGAFIGGYIADKVQFQAGKKGADRPTNVWAFLWAVVGAVVLLFVLGAIL